MGFSYKLVTDIADCDKDENYIARDSNSVIIDMTKENSESKYFAP